MVGFGLFWETVSQEIARTPILPLIDNKYIVACKHTLSNTCSQSYRILKIDNWVWGGYNKLILSQSKNQELLNN